MKVGNAAVGAVAGRGNYYFLRLQLDWAEASQRSLDQPKLTSLGATSISLDQASPQ